MDGLPQLTPKARGSMDRVQVNTSLNEEAEVG